MAIDPSALDQALTRDLAAAVTGVARPLRYRLGDAFLPAGTAPPTDARLRCCTCGFGCAVDAHATGCPLCGSHAWELLPTVSVRTLR
jgi:rubrerythrin